MPPELDQNTFNQVHNYLSGNIPVDQMQNMPAPSQDQIRGYYGQQFQTSNGRAANDSELNFLTNLHNTKGFNSAYGLAQNWDKQLNAYSGQGITPDYLKRESATSPMAQYLLGQGVNSPVKINTPNAPTPDTVNYITGLFQKYGGRAPNQDEINAYASQNPAAIENNISQDMIQEKNSKQSLADQKDPNSPYYQETQDPNSPYYEKFSGPGMNPSGGGKFNPPPPPAPSLPGNIPPPTNIPAETSTASPPNANPFSALSPPPPPPPTAASNPAGWANGLPPSFYNPSTGQYGNAPYMRPGMSPDMSYPGGIPPQPGQTPAPGVSNPAMPGGSNPTGTPTSEAGGYYKQRAADGHYDVYDANGNRISQDQFQQAGLNIDHIPEGNATGSASGAPGGASIAGAPTEGIPSPIPGNPPLTPLQSDTQNILKSLGISLPTRVQNPATAFGDTYKELYQSLGLDTVKAHIMDMNKQYGDLQQKKAGEIAAVSDNPWISESTRVGTINAIDRKYDLKITALSNTLAVYDKTYQSGRQDAQWVAQNTVSITHQQQQLDQQMLISTMSLAERSIIARERNKISEERIGQGQQRIDQGGVHNVNGTLLQVQPDGSVKELGSIPKEQNPYASIRSLPGGRLFDLSTGKYLDTTTNAPRALPGSKGSGSNPKPYFTSAQQQKIDALGARNLDQNVQNALIHLSPVDGRAFMNDYKNIYIQRYKTGDSDLVEKVGNMKPLEYLYKWAAQRDAERLASKSRRGGIQSPTF